jgi:PTS system glucose-specific IIA component
MRGKDVFDPHAAMNLTTNTNQILKIIAPISGQTQELKDVPDPVFAEKLTGDGLAILAESDTVLAPCDGEITLFFETKHAFAITTPSGIQVLVHVGLDSIILNGAGLEALHKAGDQVTAGTKIIKIDQQVIKAKNINMTSPVLIVNPEKVTAFHPLIGAKVMAGQDTVIEYCL